MSPRRLAATLAIVLAAAPLAAQEPAAQEPAIELRVGVRADARPFSFAAPASALGRPETATGPLARQGYDGYIVHICDRALVDLQRQSPRRIEIEAVEVEAGTRFDWLREGRVEILCDPSTISPARLDGLLVSPPIYLSGITYVSQPLRSIQADPCRPLIGVVEHTTAAADGIRLILDAGEWPENRAMIERFLAGAEDWRSADPSCQTTPRTEAVVVKSTHKELAELFCAGGFLNYVGDIEIVTRSLGKSCSYEGPFRTYSDDRYAIFARDRYEDPEVAAAVLAFYGHLGRGLLGTPSLLDAAFTATFPEARRSQKLDLFFWSLRGPLADTGR